MNRTPLSSISGNHARHHQYTLYQKGLICGAIDGGLTPSRIEKQYRVPKSSVRYVLSTHKSQRTKVSNPRSDRPKMLTIREQRHIIRIARRDPRITYKNFKIQAEIDCFTDIIYRLLKEENIINWICKKKFLLTSELVGKRYAWALKYENWKWENWAQVIWSDEYFVERDTGKRRQWVFRTLDQKWNFKMMQSYKKKKNVSIMI